MFKKIKKKKNNKQFIKSVRAVKMGKINTSEKLDFCSFLNFYRKLGGALFFNICMFSF